MKKVSKYSPELRAQILSLIEAAKKQGKDWNTIAEIVNEKNIFPRKFKTGRDLFKTQWSWTKSLKKAKVKTKVSSLLKLDSKPTKSPRTKRAYARRKKTPELIEMQVPEVSTNDSIILMIVKPSNIRSVLEQLQ